MQILNVKWMLGFIAFFVWGNLSAQLQTVVYPLPQQIKWGEQNLTLPSEIEVVGETNSNPYAVKLLKNLLQPSEMVGKLTIYLGERGDRAVRKYNRRIPQQPEGYYLSLTPECWVLAGNDEQGTYYAVQTLRQLLQMENLREVEITDYPVICSRGVVEGFYGTPWSHESRLRQLKFYGEQKLNTYIYGPKDDPYHSCPNWRKPYPEKEAEQIRELAGMAREYGVNFVWAIHPGQDIRWNTEDRDLLLAKFESMYTLGVRSFAVFFDDISGEGTDPERQANLLNDIDNHFVKVKGDVTPLIMCPTEYNKSWSDPKKGYLTTLGNRLNPTIQVMWTGDRVVSDVTEQGLNWVNERIQRPAYIWWNFPVSDYVRDHLLMGEVYGLERHIGREMSGFVTNPMEHAEASKIAIFSVADYAWNPEQFDSKSSWEMAIKKLLPHAAEYLQCFVNHNSDLGPNGHGYRREESKNIQTVAERFLQYYREGKWSDTDYGILCEEFARMVEAADVLSVNQENKPLIDEIHPWLEQFRNMGVAGLEMMFMLRAVEVGDETLFLRKYRHIRALQQKAYRIDQMYNQNPYQPGVQTGSRVIQPFIDSLFVCGIRCYNQKHGALLEEKVFTSPHNSYSTVSQCRHLPVRLKNNRVIISPLLEVVKWGVGEYIGIELDQIYTVKALEANFGVKEDIEWLQLEISQDGINWKNVPMIQKKHILKATLEEEIRFLRVLNKSDREQESYLRRFIVELNF